MVSHKFILNLSYTTNNIPVQVFRYMLFYMTPDTIDIFYDITDVPL